MAFVPGTDHLYTSEHGPSVDDEINIRLQASYGWDPDTGSGSYDMTDTRKFPTAVPSVWSSGSPTLAVADIEVLGPAWGRYRGCSPSPR